MNKRNLLCSCLFVNETGYEVPVNNIKYEINYWWNNVIGKLTNIHFSLLSKQKNLNIEFYHIIRFL